MPVMLGARLVEQRHRGFEIALQCAALVREIAKRGFRFFELPAQVGDRASMSGNRLLQFTCGRMVTLNLLVVTGAQPGDVLLVFRLRHFQSGRRLFDLLLQTGSLAR